jgi:hypothetical protein
MTQLEAPAVADAPDLGQAAATEPIGEAAPAAEPQVFDWSPYSDHVVELKVGGETQRVPLSEAISNGMRQADYTQKTQALAEQQRELEYAQSLALALERNPKGTIEYLQSQLEQAAGSAGADLDDGLNPLQSEIQDLRKWQSQQMVKDEFASLREQFGEIDERAVLQHALDIDAPSLEAAYAHMVLPKLLEEVAPLRSAAAERAKAEAEAEAAKRSAAGLVAGGHTPATGVVSAPDSGSAPSLREALLAAAQQHGISL